MSLPIDGEGTIRYSTGRPGREKAPAVADSPARPTTPGSTAAAMAATANRRAQWPRILSTNLIEQFHPSSGYRVTRLPPRSEIAIRQRSDFFTALSRPLD